MRFWRTPDGWLLPGGARVDWLAGGTYDRRVGLSLFTLQITHKIDANIDIERDHIIDTVTSAVPETSVEVLENFTTNYHSRNGGGESVHTDGNLPVLDVAVVVAATHLVGLATAGVQDLRTSHILGAMAAILFTVALSSPKAGEWTTR